MRIQTQFRYCRLLLFALVLILVLWRQCRAIPLPIPTYKEECDFKGIPEECANNYHNITKGSCTRSYCLLREGQSCSIFQEESKCGYGLTCSCNRCMNCYNRTCHLEICSNDIDKRVGNHYTMPLPLYKPRWQVLMDM